jgi:hypothetical protein
MRHSHTEFAFGAPDGLVMISTPSASKTASKYGKYLVSGRG